MKVNVQVLGLKQIEKKLREKIPVKARAKVMAKALKVAAKPMIASAKSNAASGPGSDALAAAMSAWTESKSKTKKSGHFVSVHIGPKRGYKKAIAIYYDFYNKTATLLGLKRGIFHGHLLEFGASRTPRRPFLGPALDAHGKGLVKSFGKILGLEIEKEAKKGVKQGRRK